jgi:hypothetical protein
MALLALLRFGTVVLLAMLVLHGYLWWRLVRGTTRPGPVRRALTALTVVLGLLPALAIGLRGTLPLGRAAPLDWAAYSWLGVAFSLFLCLVVLEPVRLLARRRRGADDVADPSRRVLLARGLAVTARPRARSTRRPGSGTSEPAPRPPRPLSSSRTGSRATRARNR